MGVGKSVIGRSVARSLGMRFIDSDRAIEDAAGMSIPDIFARQGEPAFRAMERRFIESGHPGEGCVVACGGGLPVQPGMRELLLARGVVVCLFAKPETVLERTRASSRRPLLDVEDPEARIRQLMAERDPIYMRTGIGISAEGRGTHDVASNVLRVYTRECRLRAKSPTSTSPSTSSSSSTSSL